MLQQRFATIDWQGVRILAVDEIAIRRGQRYLSVVLDYNSGRVLWMGPGRSRASIAEFFRLMPVERRGQIEAVAMDMWRPYIEVVKQWCPQAQIVFDEFHVLKDYNEAINDLRRVEYRKANQAGKKVLQGNRFLLLKNLEHVDARGCAQLQAILKLNENLSTAYVLRDQLRLIWQTRDAMEALYLLLDWCQLVQASGIPVLRSFARRLLSHAYGIVNHAAYPINNGRLEGSNNKIKVIKRKAYGFHDTEYFILKVKQAFDRPKNAT
jgi:transposase